MDSILDQGSPYINAISFVPPSPPPPDQSSPFHDDYNIPLTSPPSYNGSYHSPYSGNSELSFVGGEDLNFTLFDDDAGANLYDPTDYDAPHSGSSLLMYSDNDSYATYLNSSASSEHHRGPYDYSSPSSNGDESNERRSRASSVSSAHNNNSHQSNFHPSPRLDVAQSFENMTVRSPNWGTDPLPPLQHPQQKPPSPPRLFMPDGYEEPPTINAPDGDGVMGGPLLHIDIVPATPIAGGVNAAAGVPTFQSRLEPLLQGTELGCQQQNWDQSSTNEPHSRQNTPFRFPRTDTTTNTNTQPSSSSRLLNNDSGGLGLPANNTSFLFAAHPRTRSKSDTALEPPTWDAEFIQQQQQLQEGSALALDLDLQQQEDGGTVNMNDVLPGSQTYGGSSHQQSMNEFTFGGASNSNSNAGATGGAGGFLSPDSSQLRRSKSDSGRPSHHRQSRSEDIRSSPMPQHHLPQTHLSPNYHPPSSHGHGHHHSLSVTGSTSGGGGGFLFPPPPDFLSSLSGSNANNNANNAFLTHDTLPLPLPPIRSLSPGSANKGHYRRASSGSRSERGAESWAGGGGLLPSRVSPYPSPNASPRVRYDDLPPVPGSAGYEGEVALSGRIGMSYGFGSSNQQQQQQGGDGTSGFGNDARGYGIVGADGGELGVGDGGQGLGVVSKPNVTTGRTANASHKRRKQEATFVCPIPGCGSTFTRSFNLKGHIRSHNEEKPFQCHWPGCGKGFARQHDCKRHEQLHTNYRPFTCDGCNKQFARMDALNRHLRSEGGAECARLQEANGNGAGGGGYASTATTSPTPSESQSPPPQRARTRGGGGGRGEEDSVVFKRDQGQGQEVQWGLVGGVSL